VGPSSRGDCRVSVREVGSLDRRAGVQGQGSRGSRTGEIAVRRVVAVDAVEIEEQEDEGPGYFILTADGTTLLFAGQYLDRLKSKGFPWTAFDVSEAPQSNVFFGISAAGDRLKPSARRPPLTFEEGKAYGTFNVKYRTVDGDFVSLKESLGR
jgi:hypothetical protein